jgi:hypothetical protein
MLELGNITRLRIYVTCDEPVQTSPRIKPEWAALLFRIRENSISKFAPKICLVDHFLGFPQYDHATAGIVPQTTPQPLP